MEWNRDNIITKLGYSKAILPTTLDILAQIWNILEEEVEISKLLEKQKQIDIVIKDEIINKIKELEKKLPKYKTWNSYTTKKCYVRLLSETTYNKEQQKIKEIKEKEEKRKQEEKEKIDEKKKEFNNWRDEEWIKKNIGEYYNFEYIFEYFWTLIGDKWKKSNWQGDILIEEKIYNQIKKEKMGNTFLNRKFKIKGYSHGIVGTYTNEIVKSCGVYGIYQDKELIYIGMTMRNFETRWKEHLENIKLHKHELYFEKYMDINKEIEFEKMIDVCELDTDKVLTREDVKSMELALIQIFQPKGNLEGRTMPYRYND